MLAYSLKAGLPSNLTAEKRTTRGSAIPDLSFAFRLRRRATCTACIGMGCRQDYANNITQRTPRTLFHRTHSLWAPAFHALLGTWMRMISLGRTRLDADHGAGSNKNAGR